MKAIGIVTVTVAAIVLSTIWSGFVFSILWVWFIVPVFHLPTLSIALAVGIGIVVRMLTYQTASGESSSKGMSAGETLISSFVSALLFPLFFLIMGAVVHMFVV